MKTRLILIAAAAAAFVSCNNLLDLTPTDRVSAKTMWETTRNAQYSVNHLFSYIWGYNSSPTEAGLTEALTDELKYTSYNFNAMAYIPSYLAYFESTVTAQTIDVYLGKWGSLYVAIRETNEALSYLKAYGQMSDDDKVRLEAELKFLRGYFYFELIKRYKDVILYDEDLTAITKEIFHIEILWCRDSLPKYFTLIHALLTKERMPEPLWEQAGILTRRRKTNGCV